MGHREAFPPTALNGGLPYKQSDLQETYVPGFNDQAATRAASARWARGYDGGEGTRRGSHDPRYKATSNDSPLVVPELKGPCKAQLG